MPESLEAIITTALAKEPAKRQANAQELLDELREAQAGVLPKKLISSMEWTVKRWVTAALVIMTALAVMFAIHWWKHRPPILSARGWVLISDFDTSGDAAVPDKAIREGLTIALQQSEYVNVFPRTRAYEVLQRMKQKDASRIDENLGREICQRENLQVLLAGSVERMGQVFQIRVRALDPARGALLFAEEARFDRENQFFEEADELVKRVRNDLGESLERIEKRSRPLAQVTTSSLDALQLYSQARDASDQGKNEQVPVLLKGALRLDPDFAMAHLRLGEYYSAVGGKNEKTVAELEEAYRLRPSVTEREQRRIEAAYHGLQEQYEDGAQALRELVNLYPDDEDAHQELAVAYYDLNQMEKAVSELREVLRLNPTSAPAYRSLVLYLAQIGQAETAIAAAGEAQRRGVNPPQMHRGIGLAYLDLGDVLRARQEFQQIGDVTEADRDLQELYLVMADLYEGKLNAAKTSLVRQIQAVPERREGLQTIRRYLLARIHLSQGNSRKASLEASLILEVPSTGLQVYDVLNAGLLYVWAGRIDQARRTLRRLDDSRKSVPTSWDQSCFHTLQGEVWMATGKPREAERSFANAVHEYQDANAHAGLARAYQAQKRWDMAAREWENVLHRKGEILQSGFPPDLAFAHLQLARTHREMNHRDLARSHYQEAVRMWQQADLLPIVRDANVNCGT